MVLQYYNQGVEALIAALLGSLFGTAM